MFSSVLQEIDKKKKKKKGTLGIGNGAIFFASESDKVRYGRSRRGEAPQISFTNANPLTALNLCTRPPFSNSRCRL